MSQTGSFQISVDMTKHPDGQLPWLTRSDKSSTSEKDISPPNYLTEQRSTKPVLTRLLKCLGLEKSTPCLLQIEVCSHDGTYWTQNLSSTQSVMPTLLDLLASISKSNTEGSEYERVSLRLILPPLSLRHIFSLATSSVPTVKSNRQDCIRITVERMDTI